MPLYEYYCPQCQTRFELLRPMSRSNGPATCPNGHEGAQRVLSVFSSVSKGAGDETAPIGGDLGYNTCATGTCPLP
jgi:putative FmdB family regulatory protein